MTGVQTCALPIFIFLAFLNLVVVGQESAFELKVNFKPYKNQYIYLGYYLGKQILKFRSYDNFLETLLHEMIHAYLFLTKS